MSPRTRVVLRDLLDRMTWWLESANGPENGSVRRDIRDAMAKVRYELVRED